MRVLVLCHVGRRHVHPHRAVRRRPLTGSPQNRDMSRRGEGLLGYWTVLFVRALVEHPAGYEPLLAHSRRGHCGLRCNTALSASGKMIGFGAAVPQPARSHAYASPTPSLGSTQGLLLARAGSPLARQDSHLLDDRQSFMKASHPPIPFDQPCLVALFFLSPHCRWPISRRRISIFIATHHSVYDFAFVVEPADLIMPEADVVTHWRRSALWQALQRPLGKRVKVI